MYTEVLFGKCNTEINDENKREQNIRRIHLHSKYVVRTKNKNKTRTKIQNLQSNSVIPNKNRPPNQN